VFGELISYIRAWYYQFGGLFVPLFSRNNTYVAEQGKGVKSDWLLPVQSTGWSEAPPRTARPRPPGTILDRKTVAGAGVWGSEGAAGLRMAPRARRADETA
jgi:hypothetical protein